MDPPEKVVEYIVYTSVHPSEEVPTGWKARAAIWSHHIAPDVTEHISANIAHKSQMEDAPKGIPPTTGSLYQPLQGATGIDDGVRARIEQENAARKKDTSEK